MLAGFTTLLISFVVVTLDTQLFIEVAKQIGKEYFLVGMALCDNKPLMEQTELAYPRDIQRVMFDILSHWKNNSPKRNDPAAMVKELCCVLTRNDRNDLVEYIRGQSECRKGAHTNIYIVG